ncbi:hypothetical protein PGB90_002839 [Kerria lacca]
MKNVTFSTLFAFALLGILVISFKAQNGYQYNRPNGKSSLQLPSSQTQNGYQKQNDHKNEQPSKGYQYSQQLPEFQTTTKPITQTVGFPQPFRSNSDTAGQNSFPYSSTEITTLTSVSGSGYNYQTPTLNLESHQIFTNYPTGSSDFNNKNSDSPNQNDYNIGNADSFNQGNNGNYVPQETKNFNLESMRNAESSHIFSNSPGFQEPNNVYNTGSASSFSPSNTFGGNFGSQGLSNFNTGSVTSLSSNNMFDRHSGSQGSSNFNTANVGISETNNVFSDSPGLHSLSSFNAGSVGTLRSNNALSSNSRPQGPNTFNTGNLGSLRPSMALNDSSGSQSSNSFTAGSSGISSPTNSFGGNSEYQKPESPIANVADLSAIPGTPDKDYPILSKIPNTSFNCNDQQFPGYYADTETRCQVFHICANKFKYDFICPNGTIFHQKYFVCVWWNQFDCFTAKSLYYLNENIYDYNKIRISNLDSLSGLMMGSLSNFNSMTGSEGPSASFNSISGSQKPSAPFGQISDSQKPSASFSSISNLQEHSTSFGQVGALPESSLSFGQVSGQQESSASFSPVNSPQGSSVNFNLQKPTTSFETSASVQKPSSNYGSINNLPGSATVFGSENNLQAPSANFGTTIGSNEPSNVFRQSTTPQELNYNFLKSQSSSANFSHSSDSQNHMINFDSLSFPQMTSASFKPLAKPQGYSPSYGLSLSQKPAIPLSQSNSSKKPSASYNPPASPQELGPTFSSSLGGPQRPLTSYLPPQRPQAPINYPKPSNDHFETNNQADYLISNGLTSGEKYTTSFSHITTTQPVHYNTETNQPGNTYEVPESSYSSYQTEMPLNNNSPFASKPITKPNREYLPPYRKRK